MKNSKEVRMCIGCRKRENKYNLIRIVNSKEEGVIIDKKQNLEGRGAYICKSEECLNRIIKTKKLSKALKTNISEEKFNELRGVLIDR